MIDINNMIEIELKEQDDFLKIKETLTRIGVASTKNKTLYQSCHILHKKQKYYIVHFKELFALDGKDSNMTENDIARRNTIVSLLEEWNLLTVKNPEKMGNLKVNITQLKILNHKEKGEWQLAAKYNIGKTWTK